MKRLWHKKDVVCNLIKERNCTFYRYYSINEEDSNFSILNLKEDIVHFSPPLLFNDPFDSNIGFSLMSIYSKFNKTMIKDKQEGDIITKLIKTTKSSQTKNEYTMFWNTFTDWFSWDSNSRICFLDVVNYLFYCRNNIDFVGNDYIKELVTKSNKKNIGKNEYDFVRYLIDKSTIKRYFPDYRFENKSSELSFADYADALRSMCNLFGKDFTETNKSLKSTYNALRNIKESFLNNTLDNLKIACFSENFDNILMWSHYSNKHTGFCVEYDFSEIIKNGLNDLRLLISPINYSNKRCQIKVYKNHKLYKNNFVYVVDSIFRKSEAWKYEKEWRVIAYDDQEIKQFNNLLKITRIILGSNISKDDEKMIRLIASEKGVDVVRLKVDDSYYKLVKQKTASESE